MNCPYCKYDGTEESYRNEPLLRTEAAHATLLYDQTIVVWLPVGDDDNTLSPQALIPINFCPMCGRKL